MSPADKIWMGLAIIGFFSSCFLGFMLMMLKTEKSEYLTRAIRWENIAFDYKTRLDSKGGSTNGLQAQLIAGDAFSTQGFYQRPRHRTDDLLRERQELGEKLQDTMTQRDELYSMLYGVCATLESSGALTVGSDLWAWYYDNHKIDNANT